MENCFKAYIITLVVTEIMLMFKSYLKCLTVRSNTCGILTPDYVLQGKNIVFIMIEKKKTTLTDAGLNKVNSVGIMPFHQMRLIGLCSLEAVGTVPVVHFACVLKKVVT